MALQLKIFFFLFSQGLIGLWLGSFDRKSVTALKALSLALPAFIVNLLSVEYLFNS